MEELQRLIDSYSELSLGDKRRELGREIAELTLTTQKLLADIIPNYQAKPMEDFTNLFEEGTSEEEYLTGLYQDVIELEEVIGSYYNIVTDIYYDEVKPNEQ